MKILSFIFALTTLACSSQPSTNDPVPTPNATAAPYYEEMEGYWAVFVEILKEGFDVAPVTSQHTMFFSMPYTGPSVDVLDTAFLAVENKIIAAHRYQNPTVGQNYAWLNQDQWSIVGQLDASGGEVIVRLEQVEDAVMVNWLQDTWTFLEMTRHENPYGPEAGLMGAGPKGFVLGIEDRLNEVGP